MDELPPQPEQQSPPADPAPDTGSQPLLILRAVLAGMVGVLVCALLWLAATGDKRGADESGRVEVVELVGGGANQPGGGGDPLEALGYTTYSFGPGEVYRIDLPSTGGGVISSGDSAWPFDKSVELVWHGYSSSPLQDIVVRIAPQSTDDPGAYAEWRQLTVEALKGNINYEPEGELTAFQAGGRSWDNLPLSQRNPYLERREAIDVNMTQFGHDALSVTFYFELPPAEGIVEKTIPYVLGSVWSPLEHMRNEPAAAGAADTAGTP